MSEQAVAALRRVIGALTYDYVEQVDASTDQVIAASEDVPLLDRSISGDLLRLRQGSAAGGESALLLANATAIDEALLAAAEGLAALEGSAS